MFPVFINVGGGEGKQKTTREKNIFSRQIARYGNSLCGAYADEPMASGRSACSVTGGGDAQSFFFWRHCYCLIFISCCN